MLSCFSWVLWEVVRQSKKQQFTPDPVAEPPCPDWMDSAALAASTFLPAPTTRDVGGRQRTGCLQAPSSLNHLLSLWLLGLAAA